MSPPPSGPTGPADARVLLENAPWMRRLARTLVRDAERADELAQETWVRLLERPPTLDRPFRGWIATVMRNLVRAERRGRARREARERARASEEHAPSSHELVERAALQRELVEAVLDLAEPYRTAILLRWFEERTPTEIAARERIPLATVKTRLARGLAQLRARLAERRGPDGRVSVLAALARIETPTTPVLLSPVPLLAVMNAKLSVALVLAAALGLAAFLVLRGDEPERGSAELRPSARPATELEPARSSAPAPAEAVRESVAAEPLAPASRAGAAAAPGARRTARGRVIDAAGAPVADVELSLVPRQIGPLGRLPEDIAATQSVATSGRDGAFELVDPAAGSLFARDPRWTTLLAGIPVDARTGQECRVVVAPAIALAGVVVDAGGLAVVGAHVVIAPPEDLRARLAEVLDFSGPVEFGATTDEEGRFRLAPAPALAAGTLRVETEGHLLHSEPAPLVARDDLVVVLGRPPRGGRLAGQVVDGAGMPVSGARVSYGVETRLTDDDGRFAFRLDDPESPNQEMSQYFDVPLDVLRAVKRGLLPARLAGKRALDGGVRWPEPLVLRLGGEPLTLAGRVRDEHGEPLEGIRVWIADPTLLGAVAEDGRSQRIMHVEAEIAGAEPGWRWEETDADGRFELRDLEDREYDVAAMEPDTLLRAVEPGLRAGRQDVDLVLRRARLFPRLSGRVVDGRGAPVPDALVFPMCDALETRFSGEVIQTQHESVHGTRTDGDGRFVLERVPRDLAYLRIEAPDAIPLEWGRGVEGGLDELAGSAPEEVVITVDRRCHFQVVLSAPGEADSLGVLDAAGRPLVVSEFLGNGRREGERHALVDGRSSKLAVGDAGVMLVLYRGDAEIRRVPIALAPGEPARLEL